MSQVKRKKVGLRNSQNQVRRELEGVFNLIFTKSQSIKQTEGLL